jgi:hypothetical protein
MRNLARGLGSWSGGLESGHVVLVHDLGHHVRNSF